MSNEISYQFQLRLANGNLEDQYSAPSSKADQTNAKLIRNVQEIGTTEEILASGDIATPGWAVFLNLDDTNFIEIGSYVGGTFYPFLKLLPGDKVLCRLGVSTSELYSKSDTAIVSLFYIIYDS